MECWECRVGDRKRVWDEEGGDWTVIVFSVTYVDGVAGGRVWRQTHQL